MIEKVKRKSMKAIKNITTNIAAAFLVAVIIYLFLTIAMVPILWFMSSNPSEAINFVLIEAFPAVSWMVFVTMFVIITISSDW